MQTLKTTTQKLEMFKEAGCRNCIELALVCAEALPYPVWTRAVLRLTLVAALLKSTSESPAAFRPPPADR